MVDEYAKFALLELNTIFPLIVEPWIKMEKELIKSINISSFLDGCDDDLDDSESDDYIHDKLVHNLQKEIHKYYLKLKSQIISYSWEDIGVVQKAVITSILEKVEQLKGFIDDSPVINKYIAEPKEFINLITDIISIAKLIKEV